MEGLTSWLFIAAIAVVFWLLIIRPAARRQKEVQALQAALAVGDDVMLTSGVLGTIVEADGDFLRLEIAPGVVISVVRGAVSSIRRDDALDEPGADGTTDPFAKADDRGPEPTHDPSEER
ncbi:preprotein translocase subunit YajC [Nocardioides sp.]|uniref:preprotein translocase subunit YajC n=1 Tax=Nocardioides sp. TaxID=35761 RepID=UPI0035189A68